MAFDVDGAKQAGYSDAEIADHLAAENKFDAAGARKSGYSDAEIIAHFVGDNTQPAGVAQAPERASVEPEQSGGGALQAVGNLVAGAVRGAGSIGATILAPVDIAKDAIAGKGLSLESNRQRRADMTSALQTMGAQPESTAFQIGKIGTEIAGTAPIGGLLGRGATAVGATPKVAAALSSGGFSLGNTAKATTLTGRIADLALRTTAGATVGGASAGLANPDDAAAGAVIGGAMPGAVKAAGLAGKAIKGTAKHVLGATTGAGSEAVAEAFRAGKIGLTEFLDNMRGKVSFEDVVDEAKAGLSQMRADRQAAYRSGMVDIKADKSIIPFAPIQKAMDDVANIGRFKDVTIKSKAADTVDELKQIVEQWKGLDPAEYHTPEGMDALKQAIGDVRDSVQFGTPARRVADQLYNAVKNEITAQAPTYSKVMKEYAESSVAMKEVERALSLGEKASKDTAVRKLQSLLRNNAQTNYGNRLDLAKQLEQKGGVQLMPSIAGQAMNSWTPRGMVGAIEKAGIAGAGGAAVAGYLTPAALAVAPLTSPRLIGEGAYLLGRGVGGAQRVAQSGGNALLGNVPARRLEEINALLRTGVISSLGSQTIQR